MDNVTVEVYELLGTSEALIDTQIRGQKGEHSIPINNLFGSKKFKVVAYDDLGNRSEPELLTGYIDFVDIVLDIQPVNEASADCTDFDFVEVNFSEEIVDNSFSIDAITLTSRGAVIPKDDILIRKIGDKEYVLENIQNPTDGSIILEIDKTKIVKNLSGLNGVLTERIDIGSPNAYPVTIIGEQNPLINVVYEYYADENMNKYDWIVINGEIISKENNKVSVKWNELDSQILILRYQTPLNCTLTSEIDVIVKDATLSTEDKIREYKTNFISPVPNNGQFTIHTNIILNGCKLSIFDMTGKLVYEEADVNLSKKLKDVNVNLDAGTYLLILQNNDEKLQFKFLIK